MIEIDRLFQLADAYQRSLTIGDTTLSFRIFGDSKKLAALRGGADITVGRFNAALTWFSENWPTDAKWPDDVCRPEQVVHVEALL